MLDWMGHDRFKCLPSLPIVHYNCSIVGNRLLKILWPLARVSLWKECLRQCNVDKVEDKSSPFRNPCHICIHVNQSLHQIHSLNIFHLRTKQESPPHCFIIHNAHQISFWKTTGLQQFHSASSSQHFSPIDAYSKFPFSNPLFSCSIHFCTSDT